MYESTFSKLDRSLPSRKGTEITICPLCGETLRTREVDINGLNSWAFNNGIAIVRDGRKCDCN